MSDDIKARLDRIEAKIDAIAAPVQRITARKESRAEQAKRAGCSIRTLQHRERRERIRMIIEERLT